MRGESVCPSCDAVGTLREATGLSAYRLAGGSAMPYRRTGLSCEECGWEE